MDVKINLMASFDVYRTTENDLKLTFIDIILLCEFFLKAYNFHHYQYVHNHLFIKLS